MLKLSTTTDNGYYEDGFQERISGMVERRNKLQIYFQILKEIRSQNQIRGLVKPTHISHRVNMPYNRLKEYIGELTEVGMINNYDTYRVTEKGEKFILEYGRLIDVVSEMGLLNVAEALEPLT